MLSTQCELIGRLSEATLEVFDTMVFRALTPGTVIDGDVSTQNGTSRVAGVKVAGSVGFAGSQQSGVVVFLSGLAAAREITAAMLGMSSMDDLTGEVPDAIGEITNMIAGSFRTKMARDGDAWALSVPTVTVGADFRMRPVACRRRVLLPFAMGEAAIWVELILGN
jgi:chemotaxis protein CheX